MEIIPHVPVQKYEAGDFPKIPLFEFLDALKAFLNELDWDSFATKEELEVVATKVDALELQLNDLAGDIEDLEGDITDLRGDITEIRAILVNVNAKIAEIMAKLPNDPIDVVQCVFTNPAYFFADDTDSEYWNVASSSHDVVCSFTGQVMQSVQVADNTLEVVNIQLDDNVIIDFTKTPNHFYTPMCVEHFDAQGNFTSMQTCMLDCEITQEMSGYDISCYFHGDIANVNQYTKFHFSLEFPYFVERGNQNEEIQG